jgi:hypothetical protein
MVVPVLMCTSSIIDFGDRMLDSTSDNELCNEPCIYDAAHISNRLLAACMRGVSSNHKIVLVSGHRGSNEDRTIWILVAPHSIRSWLRPRTIVLPPCGHSKVTNEMYGLLLRTKLLSYLDIAILITPYRNVAVIHDSTIY